MELARAGTNDREGSLNFVVEPTTQFRPDRRVIPGCLGVLGIGVGMKCVQFHLPTISRILAAVVSPGMSSTVPLRISSIRR